MYRVYCLIIGLILAWCGSALTIWIPEGLHYWPNILQVGFVTVSSIVGAVGFIIIMLVLFEWWLTSESFESDHERRQKRDE